mgnify:CR=1 FL=1
MSVTSGVSTSNCRGSSVSNHGGRQLDNCLAPLTALPDVVNRVNEVNITRVEQVLDGLDSDFFEVVPLDTFLAMARAKPTFETHFAPPYNSTQE